MLFGSPLIVWQVNSWRLVYIGKVIKFITWNLDTFDVVQQHKYEFRISGFCLMKSDVIFSTSVRMFLLQWRNPECCVCLQCWNAEYRITVHRSPSSTFWLVCPILYVVYLTAFREGIWGGGMHRNHCDRISFRIIKLQDCSICSRI